MIVIIIAAAIVAFCICAAIFSLASGDSTYMGPAYGPEDCTDSKPDSKESKP